MTRLQGLCEPRFGRLCTRAIDYDLLRIVGVRATVTYGRVGARAA